MIYAEEREWRKEAFSDITLKQCLDKSMFELAKAAFVDIISRLPKSNENLGMGDITDFNVNQ
jgi:hypothetical protein